MAFKQLWDQEVVTHAKRLTLTKDDLLRGKAALDEIRYPWQDRIRYMAQRFLVELRYEKHLCKEFRDILTAADPLQAAMDYIDQKVFPGMRDVVAK